MAEVLDSQSFQANDGPRQFHDSLENNGSQGLRGFGDLRAEDQAEVEQLLAEHIASVAQARASVAGPAGGGLQGGLQVPPLGPVLLISSDSEGDDADQPPAKAPRLQTEKTGSNEKEGLPAATSTPGRKMPNMLEGVKIPEGVERTGDECSVSTFLTNKENVCTSYFQHQMDNNLLVLGMFGPPGSSCQPPLWTHILLSLC